MDEVDRAIGIVGAPGNPPGSSPRRSVVRPILDNNIATSWSDNAVGFKVARGDWPLSGIDGPPGCCVTFVTNVTRRRRPVQSGARRCRYVGPM